MATIVKGKKEFDKMPTINDVDIIPSGGTTGQVLTKDTGTNYDYSWQDASAVYGADFGEASSDGESNTTSTSYVQKVRLTTPSLDSGGKYRIGWYCEFHITSTSYDYKGRIQIGDSTDLALIQLENQDSGTDQWAPWGGFVYQTGLSGSYGIDLDYARSSSSGGTAYVRRARLEIWRVS